MEIPDGAKILSHGVVKVKEDDFLAIISFEYPHRPEVADMRRNHTSQEAAEQWIARKLRREANP